MYTHTDIIIINDSHSLSLSFKSILSISLSDWMNVIFHHFILNRIEQFFINISFEGWIIFYSNTESVIKVEGFSSIFMRLEGPKNQLIFFKCLKYSTQTFYRSNILCADSRIVSKLEWTPKPGHFKFPVLRVPKNQSVVSKV